MRIVCLVAVLCSFGCSHVDRSGVTGGPEQQEHAAVTLGNLVYVDMFSANYTTQHPLVCGAGRDFPTGREMVFRYSEAGKPIHAVFPAGVTPPETLDGKFVLHGRFQGIQNRDSYKLKKPHKDYRYFVVSSWEHGS